MNARCLLSAAALLITLSAVHAASDVSSLADRIILVAPTGRTREDREIATWQARVRAQPAAADNYERLGWAYIGKARRTLDAGYYKLAETTAQAMDAHFGESTASLLLRGHVLDNLHRFAEAETVARRLVTLRGSAYDYALLSDALMEQGRIDDAVAACQEEMNRRPGLESYGRAAHLRWLTGDLGGATQMMEAAVKASSPVDPANCAWVVSRLSGYVLQAGDAPRALSLAEAALKVAPDYPPALLARGKALLATARVADAADAVTVLVHAAEVNPLPEYQWWEADTLHAAGKADAAAQVEQELSASGADADPRTYALYLATRVMETRSGDAHSPSTGVEAAKVEPLENHRRAEQAVRLARAELTNRADPLTYDALAWSLAATGDWPAAESAMRTALSRHTRDARLLLHAGVIAQARGDTTAARADFAAARQYAYTLTPSESALLTAHLRQWPAAGLTGSDNASSGGRKMAMN